MAKYYVVANGKKKFIKSINYSEGTLEFTDSASNAMEERGGYYATPTRDFISRMFKEDYPEVADLRVYSD